MRVADPHPRVPTGGLRRRGRPRRVPGPRAAPARRRRRALLRRRRATSRASTRTRPPPGLAEANAALQTLGVDLEMAAALGDADVAALAHLVREPGRRPRRVAARRAARAHRALARTAAAVEGRAARRRLPVSSWAERQAYETADAIVAVSYGMRADMLDAYPFVDPTRVHVIHNGIDTALYAPDHVRGDARPVRHRPLAAVRRSSSAGSPGRRASATCSRPRARSTRRSSSCCAPARRTPPRSRAQTAAAVADAVSASRSGVVWIQDMLPAPRDRPAAHARRRCSSARRCTSRWAS